MLLIQILAILAILAWTGAAKAHDIVQNDSLAVLTFEIKEPKTKSNDDFNSVIETMRGIRSFLLDSGADTVRQHPRAAVACNTCHTTGKLAGHGMSINEAAPSLSCAGSGCHSLEKAGKMPFYAKGYVSLARWNALSKAEQMIDTAPALLGNLDQILAGLPELGDVKVSAALSGRGQQNTLGEAGRFSHARPADLLPGHAVAALADRVFDFPGPVTEKTKLEAKLEARTRYARHLSEHLQLQVALADILGDDSAPEMVELDIKDEYTKPPLDRDGSLGVLQNLIQSEFPNATVHKDETKSKERKFEWRDGRTEINFEWKENDKTKIEFKKLSPQDEATAMGVLNTIADQFDRTPSKREIKPKFEKVDRLLKDTKLELRYAAPEVLPLEALSLLQNEVWALLPEAVLKKEEARKVEWEIPGSPKGEIKADFKDNETKIEFKNLDMALHDEAIRVLSAVQDAYAVPARFARYELKFEAVTVDQKAQLHGALDNIEPSVRGDLLLEIKHKEDGKGTVPTLLDLTGPSQHLVSLDHDSIRLISNEVKLNKNLRFKELGAQVISSYVDSPLELAVELIDRIYALSLPRPLEIIYVSILKPTPALIARNRMMPANVLVNAFMNKLRLDMARKRIADVDGLQLQALGLELQAVLRE
ncbi:hypothetical protein CKO25_09030 [Thiocapsa imhoffii]|uniref:Cytochrome c domain-containing protein n=1 Tax=Thiocapsa imhoffii TaxID=382777 RepID=A0A9X0WHH3_9GAMM|nr:hypothetical protein [Thiocapsa imhoffii]